MIERLSMWLVWLVIAIYCCWSADGFYEALITGRIRIHYLLHAGLCAGLAAGLWLVYRAKRAPAGRRDRRWDL